MESYEVFLDLALILITAKFFGLLAKKAKAPQVVGEIGVILLIITSSIITPLLLKLLYARDTIFMGKEKIS